MRNQAISPLNIWFFFQNLNLWSILTSIKCLQKILGLENLWFAHIEIHSNTYSSFKVAKDTIAIHFKQNAKHISNKTGKTFIFPVEQSSLKRCLCTFALDNDFDVSKWRHNSDRISDSQPSIGHCILTSWRHRQIEQLLLMLETSSSYVTGVFNPIAVITIISSSFVVYFSTFLADDLKLLSPVAFVKTKTKRKRNQAISFSRHVIALPQP